VNAGFPPIGQEVTRNLMAERGLVFWHDKGRSRLLSEYLESLAKHIPMHRVLGTMPAWTCCGFAQASLKAKAMVFELIGQDGP
jgi:hypothetical protein